MENDTIDGLEVDAQKSRSAQSTHSVSTFVNWKDSESPSGQHQKSGVRRTGRFHTNQKRQASPLTQSGPSMDAVFNIAASDVEGQLNFPNQLPENLLQLYHELYDMEQKVKALENEIAVYVTSLRNNSRPSKRRSIPPRRRQVNIPRNCCIPGLWNCRRPAPVSKMDHRRPPSRLISPTRKSNSTAVQTVEGHGRNLSKVSWNSTVDVRYIGRNDPHKARLQDVEHQIIDGETKNVVHLKIKKPRDALNLSNGEEQKRERLENEWDRFNPQGNNEQKNSIAAASPNTKTIRSTARDQQQNLERQTCNPSLHCSIPQMASSPTSINDNQKTHPSSGNAIVGTSTVEGPEESIHLEAVGIPIKGPGSTKCDSAECACTGKVQTGDKLDKARKSFGMTESELSLLEKTVHNRPEPVQLKIRTEYGSVNVVSHDPDCKCATCETFGSRGEFRPRRRACSDSASVISKKIIRVHYNGDYRNIVTHTEECGCEICCNIEEHSKMLTSRRASILTHQGELLVKNKGVCGCQQCKTVEMGSRSVEVEAMMSGTSSDVFDRCYYSEATIPSMQSFPAPVATDDQKARFSRPPSINSSDTSDNLSSPSPFLSNSSSRGPTLDRTLAEVRELRHSIPDKDTIEKEWKCDRTDKKSSKPGKLYNFMPLSENWADLDKLKTVNVYSSSSSSEMNDGKVLDECEHVPSNSPFPSRTNCTPTKSHEHTSNVDHEENHSHDALISPSIHQHSDMNSTIMANITAEEFFRNLIYGKPGIEEDKIYTVTLGEGAKKAFTKIQIVDNPTNMVDENKKDITTEESAEEHVEVLGVNTTNSDNIVGKPLPRAEPGIHKSGFLLNNSDNLHSDNHSLTSPDCFQDPTRVTTVKCKHMPTTTSDCTQETGIDQRANDTPTGAFKLTIRFGKKIVCFFRHWSKKKTKSDHPILKPGYPCLKAYTINQEAPVELLQLDVKPGYFTLETHQNGEEGIGSVKQSSILSLVEKNSDMRDLASPAR